MSSQYEKRRQKAAEVIKEIQEKRESLREKKQPEVELNQVGFDIFLDDKNNRYEVVKFKYNVDTKDVVIESVKPVARHIALKFLQMKTALQTLIGVK